MTLWLLSVSLGFAGGFAVCWFFKAQAQAAVVAANKASAEVSAIVKKL